MPGQRATPAGAAQRVELIDEYDARCKLAGLLEEVTHTRGTDAHEHFDEFSAIG